MSVLTESLNAAKNEAALKAHATHTAINAVNSEANQRYLEAIALVEAAEQRRREMPKAVTPAKPKTAGEVIPNIKPEFRHICID